MDIKKQKRILTGDRPTGPLHLGHYVGSLKNRVKFQDQGLECFFIVADLHSLTTHYRKEDLLKLKENTKTIVLDYFSVGIDPEKSVIYLQSRVPEVTYLHILFSMLVSVPRLERMPTLKEVVRDLKLESASLGLLSYPVLQAADILMVKADYVPVGKDQFAHLELVKEIAQKFNSLYGETFPLPDIVESDVLTLPGTDGKVKMSKSLGNAIFLSDSSDIVRHKVMQMYTDPERVRANIPGKVEGNPVFIYHDAFNDNKEEVNDLKNRYSAGRVGDVEVKERLYEAVERFLWPIRERRAKYEKEDLGAIIEAGSKKARAEAQKTLEEVLKKMNLG